MRIDTITRLWQEELLPGWDGLYRTTGIARRARLDPLVPGSLNIGATFDVDALLSTNPDWLTSIIGTIKIPLPDDSGYLSIGDCGHGSEGYFARLDTRQNLILVVYLSDSNPFISAVFDDTLATLITNIDTSITIGLASREFGIE